MRHAAGGQLGEHEGSRFFARARPSPRSPCALLPVDRVDEAQFFFNTTSTNACKVVSSCLGATGMVALLHT